MATYYVRPSGGGPYGSANGTSYANAWAGFAAVQWNGAGKVNAGDTLYVCDTFYNEVLTLGNSGSAGSYIVIRGDYAGHPGVIQMAAPVTGAWTKVQDTPSPIIWSNTIPSGSYQLAYVNGVGCQGAVATAYTNILYIGQYYISGTTLYFGWPYDPGTISGVGVCCSTNRYAINTNAKNYITFQNLTLNLYNYGLFINSSTYINVLNNTFGIGCYGIHITATSNNIVIEYNTFNNMDNITAACINNAAATNTVTSVTVAYNKFMGGQGSAIYNANAQTGWLIYNNLSMANRTSGLNNAGVVGTVKNNIFFFNAIRDMLATTLDAHTNNSYYSGQNTPNVTYNSTTYDYTSIVGSLEATAVVTNPFSSDFLSVMNKALYAAAIASNGTIYGGYNDGTYLRMCKSTDGGATWSNCGTTTWNPASSAIFKMVDIDSQGNIYCSVSSATAGEKGLWRSTDAGSTWTRVLSPGGVIWGFDEDASGNLFCNTYIDGSSNVYKSTDHGATWVSVFDASAIDTHIHQTAVDKTTGYIYCSLGDTHAYHYSSQDGGTTWNLTCNNALMPKSDALYGGNGYIIFGSDQIGSRISKTTDNGTTFNLKANYDSGKYFFKIGGDRTNGYYLALSQAAGSQPAALYYSLDHGETWKQLLAMIGASGCGYIFTNRNAVNGKNIVCFTNTSGAYMNSYMIDLNRLADFKGMLHSDSPCINAGANVSFTADYLGAPAPYFTGKYDIGPYQAYWRFLGLTNTYRNVGGLTDPKIVGAITR